MVPAFFGATLLGAASAPIADNPPLVINGGWVRASAAGENSLPAYMIIENNTMVVQSIVLIEAEGFAGVEMLRTAPGRGAKDGQPIEQMDIPIFGRRVLEPYGEHLQLTGAKRPFRAGDKVAVIFQTAEGKTQKVVLPVRRELDE
jgi:copper(I)-binding protein